MVSADMVVTTDMMISDYVRVLPWHTFYLHARLSLTATK